MGRYRQPAGEYIRPNGVHRIADPRRSGQLFDTHYVHGAQYHGASFKGLRSGQIIDMELVPEPGNSSDHGAVALHVRGSRIGYIASGRASLWQDIVLPINRRGKAVVATGLIYEAAGRSATVYLPWLHSTVPYGPDYASECEALMGDLSADEMEMIFSKYPTDLSTDVVSRIRSHSHMAPSLNWGTEKTRDELPIQLAWHLAPTFLQLRTERRAAATALRGHQQVEAFRLRTEERMTFPAIAEVLGCSAGLASKLFQERLEGLTESEQRAHAAGEELRESQFRERVLDKYRSGMSKTAVAAELKCSPSSVASALIAFGESAVNRNETSRDDRVKRCREACRLQEQGLTRKDIAEKFHVGFDTVKALLKDGKFYEEPASDIDRLMRTRRSRTAGISALDLASSAKFLGMTEKELREGRKDHSILESIFGAAFMVAR